MQRSPASQPSGHSMDGSGAKRLNSESDRKQQKRIKASPDINGMKRTAGAMADLLEGKITNGTAPNGLSSQAGAKLSLNSSPASSFHSLVGSTQSAGNVSDQLRDYQQALQWISMQQATKNNFVQQLSVPGPQALVQTGAVPPPNLPMPVGSVPDASFQSFTATPQFPPTHAMSVTPQINSGRLPLPLNQSSLFQFAPFVHSGASALPMVMQTLEAQQLHGLTELIAANANSMLASPPAPSRALSQTPGVLSEPSSEVKQMAGQVGMKRSHGPSMDRYKNRWSEAEILNLRKGYARFGKGGTDAGDSAKCEDGQGSETSSQQYRKTDSEQVWDRILRTYEFQPCRTSRDLKDKWRQLKKKEQDDMLGVREEARRLRLLSTGPNGNLSSTSNGNSGDNDSNTSSSQSQQGASNDQAADALDSPGPSSSSPPGGSSSGSTSSPAPLTTPSAPGAADSTPQNRSSGSPVPSRGRDGGSESGVSNEEGGSEGSGQDRDSGGADGGSEGSEGGDSTEAAVSSSGGEQGEGGEGSGEDKVKAHKPAARRSVGRVPGAPVWEGGSKRKREELDQAGVPACLGLALDLGSASVSASLVRTDGSTMDGGMGQRSVHLHPASSTFNADEYLEALCGCIDDAVSFLRASQRASKRGGAANATKTNGEGAHALAVPVKVVGISCFAMSLVGVSESGAAVTPVYTCADARDAALASELRRKLAAEGALEQVERRTAPVQSAFAPALLLRLQQAAGADDKVHSWQTLSCFVLSQLTGRRQPVTLSEASVTGLLDRAEMQWHPVLLRVLGLTSESLPLLCDADELHGQGLAEDMHERWPELAHTLWSRGIAATAAANVGSRCENPRRICVSMGSHSTIRRCSATRRRAGDSKEPAGERAGASEEERASLEVPHGLWCHILNQDTTLVGASLADGASIYHWAARELAGSAEEMEGLLAEAAKMEPDAHGLTILPFFSGDGTADAKATITGMTLRTRRAELLRGMLESVALRLKKMFRLLCDMSDDNDVEVYASGEALFKSPLWQQILADALDVPIYLDVSAQRAAPVGAAVMALRAAGAEAQVKAVQDKCVYPRPGGVTAMRAAFERQEALYDRLHRS